MTINWKKLESTLFYLLVFLLPTQLAFHFWPLSSFVFGIRVDYLAPTIYLTDILFFAIFLIWVLDKENGLLKTIKKHRFFLACFVLFAVINTTLSVSILPTVYKWIKISEFTLFAYYVYTRRGIFGRSKTLLSIFCSITFFSIIGIIQFLEGHTLGWPLNLLGERSFDISTPGIALQQLFGRDFLRAYSTFSHPNSLAGYLSLSVLMLLSFRFFDKQKNYLIIGSLVLICIFLTFSLSSYLAWFAVAVFFLLKNSEKLFRKSIILVLLLLVFFALLSPILSQLLLTKLPSTPQNISERAGLSIIAGEVISKKFLVGSGLNTFVLDTTLFRRPGNYIWLLQPVHNIFLLVFSEGGILFLLATFLGIFKLFNHLVQKGSKIAILGVIFILITGSLDHYWFTIQQNLFLLTLFIGLVF